MAIVNGYAESWRSDDLKGPLRQLLAGSKLEVAFTLGHVVRESARLGLSTPLCDNLLAMMLDLESGKRQLGLHNYAEVGGLPDVTGDRNRFQLGFVDRAQ